MIKCISCHSYRCPSPAFDLQAITCSTEKADTPPETKGPTSVCFTEFCPLKKFPGLISLQKLESPFWPRDHEATTKNLYPLTSLIYRVSEDSKTYSSRKWKKIYEIVNMTIFTIPFPLSTCYGLSCVPLLKG